MRTPSAAARETVAEAPALVTGRTQRLNEPDILPKHSIRTFPIVESALDASRLAGPALVPWPERGDRRAQRSDAGAPSLLIVRRGSPVPATGPLEDWVWSDADEQEVASRLRDLGTRTAALDAIGFGWTLLTAAEAGLGLVEDVEADEGPVP